MEEQQQQDLNWTHPANAHVEIVDADLGLLKCVPPRRKFIIVGFASSTRMAAPYDDKDALIVGLNQLYRHIPRADIWSEIHHREMFLRDTVRETNYLDWLKACPIPVMMTSKQSDVPNSVQFPFEAILREFSSPAELAPVPGCAPCRENRFTCRAHKLRCDYFTSSIAYMIAYGIWAGFPHIGVYGVDLVVGVEYTEQKPCAEFWLGIARGRGIETYVPQESALVKSSHRYGAEETPPVGYITPALLTGRAESLMKRRNEVLTELNAIDGAMQENSHWQTTYELQARGASVQP